MGGILLKMPAISLRTDSAVPWAGVFSLALAIVTPFQGGIGVLSDIFTSKRFALRMQEVKVPPFVKKICSKRFPLLGKPSFIIKFGPLGQRLQKLSFYFAVINGSISVAMVAVSYLTAGMYSVRVKANWEPCPDSPLCLNANGTLPECDESLCAKMPDMDMGMAMERVTLSISGLGDSAMGLVVILASGITTAAYDLGGMSWLLVQLVDMEQFFVLGCGTIVTGIAIKLGVDCPAGNYVFAPMGLIGTATAFLGVVQSVPWFQRKFPDLMYLLHKAQLAVCASLVVMFLLLIQMARGADDFVNDNWDNCEYCFDLPWGLNDLFGIDPDFNMRGYAASEKMSREDLQDVMKPLFYSAVRVLYSAWLALLPAR